MSENTTSTLAKFIFALGCVTCLFLSACEDEEMNQLALGQECLNQLDEQSPSLATDAANCMQFVEGVKNQQADIIRCSAKFIEGGLTTTKITKAYKELNDSGNTNPEAVFMGILSLGSSEVARAAATYCERSGIAGLQYLANLAVVGTEVMNILDGFDPNNFENFDPQDVENALNECASTTNCDDAAVGGAVIAISDSYCATADSDQGVCSDVNQAIADAGGDPEQVAQRFYDYINSAN